MRSCVWIMAVGLLLPAAIQSETQCRAQGTVPREEATPALKPHESVKRFKIPEDLDISLVVSEPHISQPLSICFDDRGRMWVLQYLQFPNPNGLKPVKVDNWLRTEYDKVPAPPPHGPKGNDRISIYEDIDGDGRADTVKHFISDLNLASGMALGHGGVFVTQPPYLLFYADRDQDDLPDGDPEVLLTGFGMNDAHAFANSLTWGPDGWLYGAQGSTATADILGIGFQQGIWRYHPLRREFELFAEGGGNTWGIDFDRYGNLYAGGNTVEPLVHHVQGAYYVKGFGKHGPLHNPHTFGYFQPVKHHGYTGDSLTGGFVLYQGGAFPPRFNGNCIAPNTRHSAMRWSTLELRGSTFQTRAAGDFITTPDIWFRPVDSTVGPDGALYVADWYDYSISHSSPKNRSKWYQPSRGDGRVWRVAPEEVAPTEPGSLDLASLSSRQLIELLSHSNDWYARQARRLLAERRDPSILPVLESMLDLDDQRMALQALWSIYVTGGLDNQLASRTLQNQHPYIRAWTIRLLGDARFVSGSIARQLIDMARSDPSVIVRSQLACTAKRLRGDVAMSIVDQLIGHDEDVDDVHLPLLIWWAIEDKALSESVTVLALLESSTTWQLPMMQQILISRLARRYAAEGSQAGYAACARLLDLAPTDRDVDLVLSGIAQAFSGRRHKVVPAPLENPLARLLSVRKTDLNVLQIGLSVGSVTARQRALVQVLDTSTAIPNRVAMIRSLGETGVETSIRPLLGLLASDEPATVQSAAISAVGYFSDPGIADHVLAVFSGMPDSVQARAIELLCSRSSWALKLLEAVDKKQIQSTRVPLIQLRQLADQGEAEIKTLISKHWGKVQAATPLEKQGRITAITQMLGRRGGDTVRGLQLFRKICANCHKLHGEGEQVGPDLTGAERKDRRKLLSNLVDPNAVVRQQFIAHVAVTNNGRVITGLLADSTAETVTLLDAKNKRTVLNRNDLDELRESPISLMPDNLLEPLTDQEIRDLFAYLQTDRQVTPASSP
jgi:putative membrane-bound dehydrogenase-like protein